jgi:hypothetical protein
VMQPGRPRATQAASSSPTPAGRDGFSPHR